VPARSRNRHYETKFHANNINHLQEEYQVDYTFSMKTPHPLPPAAYLHECFLYDPDRGTLKWRKTRPPEHFATVTLQRTWTTRQSGKNAYVDMGKQGYRRTRIDGVYYLSHRIIYKMMTMDDPPGEVDHISGDRGDNRWVNIGCVTRQQNAWSCRPGSPRRREDSLGLPTGVSLRRGKYKVECGKVYLGEFDTLDAAREAYIGYASVQRGEFYWPAYRRSLRRA
jgi:hypothetical protein